MDLMALEILVTLLVYVRAPRRLPPSEFSQDPVNFISSGPRCTESTKSSHRPRTISVVSQAVSVAAGFYSVLDLGLGWFQPPTFFKKAERVAAVPPVA
jgi:hypothetical protein